MGFANEEIKATLKENGLRHVVQVQYSTDWNIHGEPVPTWVDTTWPNISDAEGHHPEYVFRNVIVSDFDDELKLNLSTEPEEEPEYLDIDKGVPPVWKPQYTVDDINKMSAQTYRYKVLHEPGFKNTVDALFSSESTLFVHDDGLVDAPAWAQNHYETQAVTDTRKAVYDGLAAGERVERLNEARRISAEQASKVEAAALTPTTEEIVNDLKAAGIPVSRFDNKAVAQAPSMADCGCGLGKQCRYSDGF